QELQQDVLDVFADVARFRERRGVGDREGDVEDARERPGEQRLARARRPAEQDVALLQLEIALLAPRAKPLVVVVDRDREDPLRVVLRDDVLVEMRLHLGGRQQTLDRRGRRRGPRRLHLGRTRGVRRGERRRLALIFLREDR